MSTGCNGHNAHSIIHALDIAVEAAISLANRWSFSLLPCRSIRTPIFATTTFSPEAIPDTAARLAKRNIGFVLRRYPDHSLLRFCEEVRPALVVGDENPLRETEHWRQLVARKLRVPLWTVDSDVVVPGNLLNKRFTAARFIRPQIQAHLKQFLFPAKNPKARHSWKPPKGLQSLPLDFDILRDWPLDRDASPVNTFRGGTSEALRVLKQFTSGALVITTRNEAIPRSRALVPFRLICISGISARLRSHSPSGSGRSSRRQAGLP